MDSLNGLKRLIIQDKLTAIYPGHGPIIKDALGKVDEYIRHRQTREDQILSLLKESPNKWFSSYELGYHYHHHHIIILL